MGKSMVAAGVGAVLLAGWIGGGAEGVRIAATFLLLFGGCGGIAFGLAAWIEGA